MSYWIENIECIDPDDARALATVRILTTDDILSWCNDPAGRRTISDATGIPPRQILQYARMADLMRINGVSSRYSALLCCAGVGSIKDLRQGDPQELASMMKEMNETRMWVSIPPTRNMVSGWIKAAKGLLPRLTF